MSDGDLRRWLRYEGRFLSELADVVVKLGLPRPPRPVELFNDAARRQQTIEAAQRLAAGVEPALAALQELASIRALLGKR
jgi:hypothetical protein